MATTVIAVTFVRAVHGHDWLINGEQHHRAEPVKAGELQIWNIVNETGMDHPFHLRFEEVRRRHEAGRETAIEAQRCSVHNWKGSAASPATDAYQRASGILRLEGQVIDDAQRPVEGARVVLYGTETSTTSGEDGTFVFENLAANRYRLAAYKGEMYAPIVSVRLSDKSEPVILRLRRGATLIALEQLRCDT